MLKSLLLVVLVSSPVLVSAQSTLRLPKSAQKTAVLQKATDGLIGRSNTRDLPSVPVQASFLNQEVLIGSTLYDIQTNAAMQNRLVVDGTDKAGVWTYSQSFDPAFPDRGTGFNMFTNGAWGPIPTTRLESVRTGWPSIVQLSDGTLHTTTHTGEQNLLSMRREPGSNNWIEASIPNNTPVGLLWPRTAAGGPDGMTIHLLALTTPEDGLGGEVYQGMNGHPLYARSLDGGLNWDKIDQIIPGLDSTAYNEIEGDTYTIIARENVVAIVIFGIWGDLALFKSYDNGETWEKTLINDFPLDKYQADQGYTVDDIPLDPFAPDSLAIYTSDGSGGAVIDAQGLVHVTYADSYVLDSDTTDMSSNFFPAWSGISYWNETMLSPALVAGLIDYNQNDTIDLEFAEIPRYGNGTITSQAQIAADDAGGVYIVYSMITEAFYNELDAQNYRHLVTLKSLDGGQTWGPPYDIINPELSDPEVYEFIEAVFPSAYALVNDTFHILYQQDFFPGYRSVDESDPIADNFAVYTGVPVNLIPSAGSVSTRDDQWLDFLVYPNPVSHTLNIKLGDRMFDAPTIDLFNAQGQLLVREKSLSEAIQMDISGLPPGFYFLKISNRSQVGFKTIVKGEN